MSLKLNIKLGEDQCTLVQQSQRELNSMSVKQTHFFKRPYDTVSILSFVFGHEQTAELVTIKVILFEPTRAQYVNFFLRASILNTRN